MKYSFINETFENIVPVPVQIVDLMPNIKENKQKIISSAKKFKTRKDWNLNDPKAYGATRRLNLVDEATNHMDRLGNRFLRCIYALEVKNKKQIYIGLTYNYTRRIRDHLKSKRF